MEKNKIEKIKKCPYCGKTQNQVEAGVNASGTQRCKCKECKKYYTIEPKKHEYCKQTRQLALKLYYSGISARGHKNKTQTRENIYIMTMVSRQRRRIVGVEIAQYKSAYRIQRMVDNAPEAKKYCTDGYNGYLDVIYPGEHVYNKQFIINIIKRIHLQ